MSALRNGVLAQLGEHLPYKQRVIGSNPIRPISFLQSNKHRGCPSKMCFIFLLKMHREHMAE